MPNSENNRIPQSTQSYSHGIKLSAIIQLAVGLSCFAVAIVVAADTWSNIFKTSDYDKIITDTAHRHGITEEIIRAIIKKESSYRPWQVGADDEIGLMQITEGAAKDWELHHNAACPPKGTLFEPRLNIEIGAWYFANALKRWSQYRHSHALALAQYNAGPGQAKKWAPEDKNSNVIDKVSFPGTKNYIKKVLKYRNKYRNKSK